MNEITPRINDDNFRDFRAPNGARPARYEGDGTNAFVWFDSPVPTAGKLFTTGDVMALDSAGNHVFSDFKLIYDPAGTSTAAATPPPPADNRQFLVVGRDRWGGDIFLPLDGAYAARDEANRLAVDHPGNTFTVYSPMVAFRANTEVVSTTF